jgi:hypothetical protein
MKVRGPHLSARRWYHTLGDWSELYYSLRADILIDGETPLEF